MWIQIVDIVLGFALAVPLLDKIPNVGKTFDRWAKWLLRYEVHLSIIAMVLGLIHLVDRIFSFVPLVFGSYPSALWTLLLGLAASKDIKQLEKIYKPLEPYKQYLGLIVMAYGIYWFSGFLRFLSY